MFFLISFALAKNFCIEKSKGRCQQLCRIFNGHFDNNYTYIPSDKQINSNDNIIHNIYVADVVNFEKSSHNIIPCDPSIYLTYKTYVTKLIIRDDIEVNTQNLTRSIPILFRFNLNLTLEIETMSNRSSVIIESANENGFLKPIFLTENVPNNLISFSNKSKNIQIYDITDKVKTIFNDTSKLVEIPKTYYCISDKLNKCQAYSSFNLTFVNSTSEVTNFPLVLIVDSSKQQLFVSDYSRDYVHIISLPGSDITYYPSKSFYNNSPDFYFIQHEKSIEMTNCIYEGKGKLTLAVPKILKLHSTTENNNFNLSFKALYLFDYDHSRLYAYRSNFKCSFNNKITVPEFHLFHGDKSLIDLFEPNKFICQNEFINTDVTSDKLKDYHYEDFVYKFANGEHEIPVTWKKSSKFTNSGNTNFTFKDVYKFSGYYIDNFIYVSSCNTIKIKPAKYFYLKAFSSYPDKNMEIQVDHDFIMNGGNFDYDAKIDRDEIDKRKCTITGKGTITFINKNFMNDVKEFCTYDEKKIIFKFNSTNPKFNVCVGRESLDKCKSEIENISLLSNREWIWVRNIDTIKILNIDKVFITDDQITSNSFSYVNLSSNAHLIKLTSSYIEVYKNGIQNIKAYQKSAKLTVIFNVRFYYYESYEKKVIEIRYYDAPIDIDLRFYLNYINVKLYQYYIDDFIKDSIKINGKGLIYIRKPYIPMIKLYKITNDISFEINTDPDYHQICYAKNVSECKNLNDFVFANNYDKFVYYDSPSTCAQTYLYQNISLTMNTNNYICNYFICHKRITIFFDFPDSVICLFYYNTLEIIADKTYDFDLYDYVSLICNIKDTLTFDSSSNYYKNIKIKFLSSKNSVEIIANSNISRLNKFKQAISVPENFTIYSPVPHFIKNIFNTTLIYQSSLWSYLYMSEEGKELFHSYPSLSFYDYFDDTNLSENIVLAVGKNDTLLIPSNWSYHNIYVLQDNVTLLQEEPYNLTYLKDGLILHNKTKIVSGILNINVPAYFTVNAYLPNGIAIQKLMYKAHLICSRKNSPTTLYIGTISVNQSYSNKPVRISGYNSTNKLKIKGKSHDDQYDLNLILYKWSADNVDYDFGYDYICYYPTIYSNSKCTGKYYQASDITTLLVAVKDNPNIPIYVGQSLEIPCCTGYNFIVNPKETNIEIKLPFSPYLMKILNESIYAKYYDSYISILNKTKLEIGLEDSLKLDIESNTESSITFNLGSDVFVSTNSNYSANFAITVKKNSYHFWAEAINDFGNVFGDYLEEYIKMCAYENDNYQLCSFERRDLIDNVFKEPFRCNEVEIVLSENDKVITLPSIYAPINVNLVENSSAILSIQIVSIIQMTSNNIIINEYWRFNGNIKNMICILDESCSISIPESLSLPLTLQLSNYQSIINLKDCAEPNYPQITIHKHGKESNEITVFGDNTTYTNFINSISSHDGIKLIRNGTQKYLCVCNDDQSYLKCLEGVEGVVDRTNKIISDPGKDVKIRIFSNVEMSSNIFTNEHDVIIDENCKFNLTDAKSVNQNYTDGIQVDKLFFTNCSYLLLKPSNPILNITMKIGEFGLHFSIEISSFLKLFVVNSNDKGVNASRIYVSGRGELNTYNYPFNKIRATSSVRVIKGVYIICNSNAGSSRCSYQSNHDFVLLNTCNDFREDFDPNSKILVFLDTYTSILDVDIHILKRQKIQFVRKPMLRLLENQVKLRFLSTIELTNKADLTTELSGSIGGACLDNDDSDLFIIGFNESLSIKQEGKIPENISTITIQPMAEKVEILIDDSVDIKNQKIKIETEEEKTISVSVLTNKTYENETIINEIFEADPGKVEVNIIPLKTLPSLEEITPVVVEPEEITPIIEQEKITQTVEQEDIIQTVIKEKITPTAIPDKITQTVKIDEIEPTMKQDEISQTIDHKEVSNIDEPRKGLSKGIIIGIVIAIVCVIVVIVVLLVIFFLKKKQYPNNILRDVNSDSSGSVGI